MRPRRRSVACPAPGAPGTGYHGAMETSLDRLLPSRSQPLVAALVATALVAMAAWYVAAGGPWGGLVDHDTPPSVPLEFTVDVNAAGETELAQLPGIGPALARRIVDRRSQAGPFGSADDLLDVPGIGPATLEALRPHLRVPAAPPLEAAP